VDGPDARCETAQSYGNSTGRNATPSFNASLNDPLWILKSSDFATAKALMSLTYGSFFGRLSRNLNIGALRALRATQLS